MTTSRIMQDTSLVSFFELNDVGSIGDRQYLVYSALADLGQATDWEITKHLGKNDPNFVRPRRKELYDRGMIRAITKRPCQVTGKTVLVWEVVRKDWVMPV